MEPEVEKALHNFDDALQTSFVFKFLKSPELTYSTQSVTFPGITVGEIPVNHKNYKGFIPDNVVHYDDLNIMFVVDEQFKNYNYLYQRMLTNKFATQEEIAEVFDELHVFRLGSNKQPISDVVFHMAFCTNLSSFEYNVGVSDNDAIICTATFKFQTFTIKDVSS